MKVNVEVDTNCCDDCPFYIYCSYEDCCVLADIEVTYEDSLSKIPEKCPLLNERNIKYSNVNVIE